MSQTILPPSPQPEPQPPTQFPAQPPTYYYPANDTSTVIVSEPPPQGFEPDPPKKQPLIWRMIKWPIRQIFKLIYLIVHGARSHKVITAILLITRRALLLVGVLVSRHARRVSHHHYKRGPSNNCHGHKAQPSGFHATLPLEIASDSEFGFIE